MVQLLFVRVPVLYMVRHCFNFQWYAIDGQIKWFVDIRGLASSTAVPSTDLGGIILTWRSKMLGSCRVVGIRRAIAHSLEAVVLA